MIRSMRGLTSEEIDNLKRLYLETAASKMKARTGYTYSSLVRVFGRKTDGKIKEDRANVKKPMMRERTHWKEEEYRIYDSHKAKISEIAQETEELKRLEFYWRGEADIVDPYNGRFKGFTTCKE